MTNKQLITLLCAGALGAGSSIAIAACGEDRGGVEVEGGGTAGATTTTPTTPTTASPTATAE